MVRAYTAITATTPAITGLTCGIGHGSTNITGLDTHLANELPKRLPVEQLTIKYKVNVTFSTSITSQ